MSILDEDFEVKIERPVIEHVNYDNKIKVFCEKLVKALPNAQVQGCYGHWKGDTADTVWRNVKLELSSRSNSGGYPHQSVRDFNTYVGVPVSRIYQEVNKWIDEFCRIHSFDNVARHKIKVRAILPKYTIKL